MRLGQRDAEALPLWRAGDRFASSTLRNTLATSPIIGVSVIIAGLAASWIATYLLGGARQVVPHFWFSCLIRGSHERPGSEGRWPPSESMARAMRASAEWNP